MRGVKQQCLTRGVGSSFPRAGWGRPGLRGFVVVGVALAVVSLAGCTPTPNPGTDTPTSTVTDVQTPDGNNGMPTEPEPVNTGDLPITKPKGSHPVNLAELAYQFKAHKWGVDSSGGKYTIGCTKESNGQRDGFVFTPNADGTVDMHLYGSSGSLWHTFANEKDAATSQEYFSNISCVKM